MIHPEPIENPLEYIGKLVHVQGWLSVAVFILTDYIDGVSYLKTRKTNKKYQTTNKLLKPRYEMENLK